MIEDFSIVGTLVLLGTRADALAGFGIEDFGWHTVVVTGTGALAGVRVLVVWRETGSWRGTTAALAGIWIQYLAARARVGIGGTRTAASLCVVDERKRAAGLPSRTHTPALLEAKHLQRRRAALVLLAPAGAAGLVED